MKLSFIAYKDHPNISEFPTLVWGRMSITYCEKDMLPHPSSLDSCHRISCRNIGTSLKPVLTVKKVMHVNIQWYSSYLIRWTLGLNVL
jgi:hypothetical protein